MNKLPQIAKPLFDLLVPSKNKTVKCRPFVVREEKILLTAQSSGAEKDIVLAIKQVLNNCIVEEDFDVNGLATFDLEYMFLKLRARSVNNIIEVSYRDIDDGLVYDFEIDLDSVEMLTGDLSSNKITINESVGLVMRYPTVSVLENSPENVDAAEMVEYLVRSCIDCVFEGDEVYYASEYNEAELTEFIESLDIETFDKIRLFFDNIPKMYHKIEYKNSVGEDRKIELTSLSDFFTWG